jgi:hypothetical protein
MNKQNEVKSGIYTSEFWVTLGAQLIPVLVLLGILGQEEAGQVQNEWAELVKAAFALLASAGVAVAYIWGRAKVKANDGN